MAPVYCIRCKQMGYVTKASAPIPSQFIGEGMSGDVVTVKEDVLLCAKCRGQADRENEAAKKRRS